MAGDDEYRWRRHAGLDRRAAYFVHQAGHALRAMPGRVRMHGLEIVVAEHEDHQRQGRIHLDSLGQSEEPVAPRLEGSSIPCDGH